MWTNQNSGNNWYQIVRQIVCLKKKIINRKSMKLSPMALLSKGLFTPQYISPHHIPFLQRKESLRKNLVFLVIFTFWQKKHRCMNNVHEFMLDCWEGVYFWGALWYIYKLFLKKSGKHSLSYVHDELFTIQIASMEREGVQ